MMEIILTAHLLNERFDIYLIDFNGSSVHSCWTADREQLGVLRLSQEHFNMWVGGDCNQKANLVMSGQQYELVRIKPFKMVKYSDYLYLPEFFIYYVFSSHFYCTFLFLPAPHRHALSP